jgi:hypothetical protein
MKEITFEGCKHLIYDRTKLDARMEIVEIDGYGAHWYRPRNLALDGIVDCQFCTKRGRIHGRLACLKNFAECGDYENAVHVVNVDRTR